MPPREVKKGNGCRASPDGALARAARGLSWLARLENKPGVNVMTEDSVIRKHQGEYTHVRLAVDPSSLHPTVKRNRRSKNPKPLELERTVGVQ